MFSTFANGVERRFDKELLRVEAWGNGFRVRATERSGFLPAVYQVLSGRHCRLFPFFGRPFLSAAFRSSLPKGCVKKGYDHQDVADGLRQHQHAEGRQKGRADGDRDIEQKRQQDVQKDEPEVMIFASRLIIA